jgi:hypothetical protein
VKRAAPLKRTAFKSKSPPPRPVKTYEVHTPRPAPARILRMADTRDRLTVVPKNAPLQHQGYMNLVRAMPCIRCAHPPRSQFCHSDEGKGTGIKSDCRTGWPGCAACHYAVGTERIYPKHERRALEALYAKQTRDAIRAAGLWPKRLPPLKEDE